MQQVPEPAPAMRQSDDSDMSAVTRGRRRLGISDAGSFVACRRGADVASRRLWWPTRAVRLSRRSSDSVYGTETWWLLGRAGQGLDGRDRPGAAAAAVGADRRPCGTAASPEPAWSRTVAGTRRSGFSGHRRERVDAAIPGDRVGDRRVAVARRRAVAVSVERRRTSLRHDPGRVIRRRRGLSLIGPRAARHGMGVRRRPHHPGRCARVDVRVAMGSRDRRGVAAPSSGTDGVAVACSRGVGLPVVLGPPMIPAARHIRLGSVVALIVVARARRSTIQVGAGSGEQEEFGLVGRRRGAARRRPVPHC